MARGNQRDKAREKNQKEQAGKVCSYRTRESYRILTPFTERQEHCMILLFGCCRWGMVWLTQGQQTGTEFARTKENVAEIMRAKQAAGTCLPFFSCALVCLVFSEAWHFSVRALRC